MKKILLAALFCSGLSPVFAQYDKYPVDLNSTSIKTVAFPFDVRFIMTGKAPDNCLRIDFYYKVSDKEKDKNGRFKKWITLPKENPDGTYYQSGSWTRQGAETDFNLTCEGLHPDMQYDFKFEELLSIANDATLKSDLKQALAARVQQFAASVATTGFQQADINAVTSDLNSIVKAKLITDPAKQELRQKGSPANSYSVNLTGDLQAFTAKALTFSGLMAAAQADLNGSGQMEQHAQAEFTLKAPQLIAEVDQVLGDNAGLTANSKTLLDMVVTPSIDGFKTYTLRTGLMILKKLAQNPGRLTPLIERKASILNNDFSDTPAADGTSLDYLTSLLKYLAGGTIATAPPAAGVKFNYLGTLNSFMQKADTDVQVILAKKKDLTDLLATFPDVTTNILIAQSLTADVLTVSDVSTAATPYISLDAGLGYASTLGTGYSYVGANFYFAPVNKKAPLGRFKGINWLRKFACLSLGYATYYGERAPNTYSILGGDGKNDLMVGLGLRLTRVLKVNLNTVPYLASSNPLTNDKTFRVGFSAGIGLDINLLGALGDTFTKGLKISK